MDKKHEKSKCRWEAHANSAWEGWLTDCGRDYTPEYDGEYTDSVCKYCGREIENDIHKELAERKKEISFLEAVILISSSNGRFELCGSPSEQAGTRSCICVYDNEKDGEFIGKLRWPIQKSWTSNPDRPAEVDEGLETVLRKYKEGEE